MEIRIIIPRPWLTFGILAVAVLFASGVIQIRGWSLGGNLVGSGGQSPMEEQQNHVQTVNRERVTQAVLSKREDILRYQLQLLEHDALSDGSSSATNVQHAREELLMLIQERTRSEAFMTEALQALWTSEGILASKERPTQTIALLWPVSPRHGISAHFDDPAYEARFGFAHHAIDIPVEQGTIIQAPADGVVKHVALNGMGYSYLVVEHGNGVSTIYGHIQRSLVQEGDRIHAGDEIAVSGGMPGTEGAGPYTTGPHLHFAVSIDGTLYDPLELLDPL